MWFVDNAAIVWLGKSVAYISPMDSFAKYRAAGFKFLQWQHFEACPTGYGLSEAQVFDDENG